MDGEAMSGNLNMEYIAQVLPLVDDTTLRNIGNVISGPEGQEFLKGFISTSDSAGIAGLVNDDNFKTFLTRLLPDLDLTLLNPVLFSNPEMLGQMLGALDPRVLAAALNTNPTLLSALMVALNNEGGKRMFTQTMLAQDEHLMKYLALRVSGVARLGLAGGDLFWINTEAMVWMDYTTEKPAGTH
jgi:hypothetical protein